MTYEVGTTQCQGEGCEKEVKNHAWGKIKDGEGWFFSKDGKQAFCPEHLPDWVPAWRARQNKLPGGKAVWKGGSEQPDDPSQD